jgi:eukaryotic-like serine/threonine-protein kinase
MSDAGQWRRVKDVLQSAIDRPEEARPAFLDEACAGDDELRREVDSLLTANRAAGGFLSKPVVAERDTNLQGRRIGPYLMLGQIGYGGMGVVYRAVRDDDVFEKIVALKLVHGGAVPEHLGRLARERQILARLEHPNIATILDGGATEDAEPYLVMEYVEGTPIDAHCNARGLSTRERLTIFRAVCGAVHHAHQNLVVHRDIKPQNILVTTEGQPKLLDFGIAKLLAAGVDPDAAPTSTLLPMMTPEYASPEQVRGQPVTTATDVYSLGVVLYQLLTGRLPVAVPTSSLEGIVRSVCETEPALPSVAARSAGAAGTTPRAIPSELRGDLDTILLKALRKEPLRRYLSVQELSEDLGRHLDGRPVRARPDTPGYRVGKFAGRHRAGVAAAVLLLVSLVTGLATTFWQWRRAERRFADVRALANSLLFEFDDAIKDLPGSTRARELVVTRAVEYLDSLAREAGGDTALQRDLAVAYHRIGDVQGNGRNANLGDSTGALASYRKALAIQKGLVAASPADGTLRRELGRLYASAGDVQTMVRDLDGAQASYDKALAIQEELAASDPLDAAARRDAATSLDGQAAMAMAAGDLGRAQERCRKALTLREAVAAADPRDDETQRELAGSYKMLGDILNKELQASGALELHRRALGIRQTLLARRPGNARLRSETAASEMQIGDDLLDLGDLPSALPHFRKSVEMLDQIASGDPNNAQARWLQGLALNNVGYALRELGHPAEAFAPHRGALALFERLSRADPSNDTYRHALANTLQLLGEADEALAHVATTADARRDRWRGALSAYESSAAIFLTMRKGGTLSVALVPDAERVDRGLADSKAALARLNPAER